MPNWNIQNIVSSLSLPAHGRLGQGQHLLWRRISQSEIRNLAAAEKRGRANRQEFSTTFWVQSKSLASAKKNEPSYEELGSRTEMALADQAALLVQRPRCMPDREMTTVTNPKMRLVDSALPPSSIEPVMMGPPARQTPKAWRYLFIRGLLSGGHMIA